MSQKNNNNEQNQETGQNAPAKSDNTPEIKAKSNFLPPSLLIVGIFLLGAVFYLSFSWYQGNKVNIVNKEKAATEETSESNKTTDEPIMTGEILKFSLVKPVFAHYEEMEDTTAPTLAYAAIKRNEIENLKNFMEEEDIEFSGAQLKALEEAGFFLADNNIISDQSGFRAEDDFVDMYDSFDGDNNKFHRKQSDAIFITSDLALHLYHILIDRSFQRIEETRFQPMLRSMSESLFLNSIKKYNESEEPALKDTYKRLSAYYLIPLLILDAGVNSAAIDIKPEQYRTFAQYLEAMNNIKIANSEKDLNFSLDQKNYRGLDLSDDIYKLAKAELELIQGAKGVVDSPMFTPLRPDFFNDYSQFKPRSHYTKNDILKSYFIAMMWYGRMGFTLSSPELTRDALVITAQINNLKVGGEKLSKLWSDMSAVIDFFVGEVDDLTAYQYTDIIKKVFDPQVGETNLADDELILKFIARAKTDLPAPKIISEALNVYDDGGKRDELLAEIMQFRFMGQRFTPDAYIINNLTQGAGAPDPETGQKLPTMPTVLMPIHVIARENQIVKNYLDVWINDPARIKKQNRESDKIIAKTLLELNTEFAGYEPGVWAQNIYWSWLNCYRPLLSKYGAGHPWFMQQEEWQKKNLGTVLGSFTELKHDTLLYAKQSYAELGGGGPNPDELPPVVKGYVEPDLIFWNRITALAKITQAGLKEKGVFPQVFEHKYKAFIEASEFFQKLAGQELADEKISGEDFEKLRTISGKLSRIVRPILNQELTKKEKRAGIIADIHTDAIFSEILYEATGKPYIIYAAVKDVNGVRLTRGAVFNHYEFINELDSRLADEDWQEQVYENKEQLPPADQWTLDLVK